MRVFQQLDGSRQEYLRTSSATTCPLLQHYLPLVARDMNRESLLRSEAFAQEAWNELRDNNALRSKGPKPALCRWYSWVDAYEHSGSAFLFIE